MSSSPIAARRGSRPLPVNRITGTVYQLVNCGGLQIGIWRPATPPPPRAPPRKRRSIGAYVSNVRSRSEFSSLRNRTFDAVDEMSRLTSAPDIAATLRRTVEASGYTSLGINGLPPPREGADPVILTEVAPEGFRDCYVEERFYLVDHISNHARVAYEPFRYSEARHFLADASRHKRFMQAIDTFGLGRGLVVPIGRPYNIPASVWLAGENPDFHDDGYERSNSGRFLRQSRRSRFPVHRSSARRRAR